MQVLLDHCIDYKFSLLIHGHLVKHTKDLGWENLSNGMLIAAAEEAHFDVLVTVDKNIRHQQNFKGKTIALVTLAPVLVDYDSIAPLAPQLLLLLDNGVTPGESYILQA